jgi:hypothetical protein
LSYAQISLALVTADHSGPSQGRVRAPDRGKGSHRAFFRVEASGRTRLVIVPQGKDIPRGTTMSILDQSGLSREAFIELL